MTGNGESEHRVRRGRASLASSGLLTALILAAVLGGIGFLWSAHLRGRLHKFSSVEVPPETSTAPRPGGQDLLDLHRITPGAGLTPQFTGLTLMPGIGMGVLQLTVELPGREPTGIMPGTSIEKLQGSLAPFTNLPLPSLQFTPFSVKVQPANGVGDAMELLGARPATQVRTDILPGGTGATATFASVAPPNPDGSRPAASPLETTVSSTISGRGLEVTITAKNISDQPQQADISWSPRFLLPGGGLEQIRITPPQTTATGPEEKSSSSEIAPASDDFHRSWTGLKHSYLSAGPALQLRNLADGYTLGITALTPSIRTIKVDAEPGSGNIQVHLTTQAMPAAPSSQPTVIGQGESLQWRARVQVTSNQSYVAPAN